VGGAVSENIEPLILDLLEWIGPEPRPYGEVLDAWKTSCPRLPVWEDATDRGFIVRSRPDGAGAVVSVTPLGADHLRQNRPRSAAGEARSTT
jgi:hypothetical protein